VRRIQDIVLLRLFRASIRLFCCTVFICCMKCVSTNMHRNTLQCTAPHCNRKTSCTTINTSLLIHLFCQRSPCQHVNPFCACVRASPLCANISLLCLNTSLSCVNTSLLCVNASLLCANTSLLCLNTSLSCVNTSFGATIRLFTVLIRHF